MLLRELRQCSPSKPQRREQLFAAVEKLTLIFTRTLICQNRWEREDPPASLLLDPRELCRMLQVGGVSGAAPAPRQDSPNAGPATSTQCSHRKEPRLKCPATRAMRTFVATVPLNSPEWASFSPKLRRGGSWETPARHFRKGRALKVPEADSSRSSPLSGCKDGTCHLCGQLAARVNVRN